jgi:hypothetical protein
MAEIKISWKAFEPRGDRQHTSVSFSYDAETTDNVLLNAIFRDTNLYCGEIWEIIQPKLSELRTHTALSVGDEIEIDGRVYLCENIGWKQQNPVT